MGKPVGFAVKVSPPRENTEEGRAGGRGIVWVPMTRPEEPRNSRVPDTVMPGLFGRIVVPWIRNPVGFAVKVSPPRENTGEAGAEGKGIVWVPMTRFEDPKDTSVPDTVIIAPGVMNVPATE